MRCDLFSFSLSLSPASSRRADTREPHKASLSRDQRRGTIRGTTLVGPETVTGCRRGQPLACAVGLRGRARTMRRWTDPIPVARPIRSDRIPDNGRDACLPDAASSTANDRGAATSGNFHLATRPSAVRIPRFLRRADTRSTDTATRRGATHDRSTSAFLPCAMTAGILRPGSGQLEAHTAREYAWVVHTESAKA